MSPTAPCRVGRGHRAGAAVRRALALARAALGAARARPGDGRGGRAGRVRRRPRPLGPAARHRQGAGLPAPDRRQPLPLRAAPPRGGRAARRPRGAAVRRTGADEAEPRADRRAAVLDALRSLPERQREVLSLRYYLELSEAEIAEALGISRGAVKSHASRGSAALRTALATYLEDRSMTTWDDHEAALALLVVDAVADVEPDDALADLRARTRTPARRRWVLPTASAGLVAAAVVVAVAVLGNDERPTAEPEPAPSACRAPRRRAQSPTSRARASSPVERRLLRRRHAVRPAALPRAAAVDARRPRRTRRRTRRWPSAAAATPTTGPCGPPARTAASRSADRPAGDLFVVEPHERPGRRCIDQPAGMTEEEACAVRAAAACATSPTASPAAGVRGHRRRRSRDTAARPADRRSARARRLELDVLSHVCSTTPREGERTPPTTRSRCRGRGRLVRGAT